MDMNTEFPGLAIRKYVEPVEDMEPTPKAPELHARGVHSGEIYRHLGVPIRRKCYTYGTGGSGIVIRYAFGHWDADLASIKDYTYAGTVYYMYHPSLSHYIINLKIPLHRLEIDPALFWLNKSIRFEVQDTMPQNTGVVFGFELSNKAVHWSYPHDGWTFGNSRPKGFYRTLLRETDFRNLIKVTLNAHCGRTFPNHSAELPARRTLIRQASSIRYIADHCPFLRTFGLQPYLKGPATWGSMKRRLRNVAPKSVEALILALI